MIEFRKVTSPGDPLFGRLYALYCGAFPSSERRELEALKRVWEHETRFEVEALLMEGEFAGLFTHWTFDRFRYVEHFAIEPSLRGHHIGSQVMQAFLDRSSLPVVLEVEMPDTHEAIRRIHFYERLGMRVLSHAYAQPYYDGSGRVLPMQMMSNNLHFADNHFQLIKSTLYRDVYGQPLV